MFSSKIYKDISHSENIVHDMKEHMSCIFDTRTCYFDDSRYDSILYKFGFPDITWMDWSDPEINDKISKLINQFDRRFVSIYIDIIIENHVMKIFIQGVTANEKVLEMVNIYRHHMW